MQKISILSNCYSFKVTENEAIKIQKLKEDIWGLGCILFDICTIELEFDSAGDTLANVYESIPFDMHPQVSPFIPLLLDYNHYEGLTLEEMQKHLFLNGSGNR